MKIGNILKLTIAIAVSELAGVIGSFFTVSSIPNWYAGLVKPALNPPAWVFGPAWTMLYALMGISLFLIWKINPSEARVGERRRAVTLFFIQLFLNAIWSIIFFGLHGSTWLTINNLGWALVDIILLWLAIVWTMVVFYKISRPAAYLLVPYLLWVSFAMYLNYAIWALN
ncbi:MAG: tryptophan-rich sensory protein [Candidatus Niyogibacteria bacterium]|nr:MAG: tryptophan-rich sensory protein [Candidatus Niyogibacteria bacterium]